MFRPNSIVLALIAGCIVSLSAGAQNKVDDLILPPPPEKKSVVKAKVKSEPAVQAAPKQSAEVIAPERVTKVVNSKEKTRQAAREYVAQNSDEGLQVTKYSSVSDENGLRFVELPLDSHFSDSSEVTVKRATSVKSVSLKEPNKDPFEGLNVTPVSDSQFNRFVFPEPVLGVYFPEGAPLADCPTNMKPQDTCGPIFLNGRKVMLLQLLAGAKGPTQMVVNLHSGRVLDLNLVPTKGPGAVVRVDGADEGVSDARRLEAARAAVQPGGSPANEANVSLLARFARGEIPAGFASEAIGAAQQYPDFDLMPLAKWGNGGAFKVHLMQVYPSNGKSVSIDVSMFRNDRIKAVALDKKNVHPSKPGTVYLLEQVGE